MSAMPWEAHGMNVVGEAGNGEKALEFLKDSDVDLLITDLAMPVMSGIELIRIVRKRYPAIAIAVLTLHQDFEYIQEALRLGAIDYIAKVELEKRQFGEVLGRIHSRISEERTKLREHAGGKSAELLPWEPACALLPLGDKPIGRGEAERLAKSGWRAEAGGHVFIWLPDRQGDRRDPVYGAARPSYPVKSLEGTACLIELAGAQGLPVADAVRWLEQYRTRELFYDIHGEEEQPIRKSVQELQAAREEAPAESHDGVTERLQAFQWLHDERAFLDIRDGLQELRLPVPKLMQVLYGLTVDWNRLFHTMTHARMKLPDAFRSWRETVDWLRSFQQQAVSFSGSLQLSPEVSGSVIAAIRIVHEEMENALFAIDVAKRVNLSRSHFNQCFKAMAGFPFNEYLRKVRIDKAREYLERTSRPIVWIAEHTGYADEKYFSRVFREQTGLLPSEYRAQHKTR